VLGFAGNFLATKVDFDLLGEFGLALPRCTLLLIGPAIPETRSALQRLGRLPNVRWIGRDRTRSSRSTSRRLTSA
jgi:hypothetical protein